MATHFNQPGVPSGSPTDIDTELKQTLGTEAWAYDASLGWQKLIYLQGVASTVQGSWVSFDEAYVTTLLVANAKGRVAVALAAVVASSYGWYVIKGKVPAKVLASFADNGLIYATATAGSVDDAVVAGDLVVGAIGRSAIDTPVTGQAYVELNYPFSTDALG
jgi:hypothetical protein